MTMYAIRWHPEPMSATPRCPHFRWMLLLRSADAVYPTRGDRKTRDMTTKVRS